ncbi:MAG: ComEA family DNA-binding protein [Planctomycetota bacterium]|jgi:competence protein ComEA
MRRKLASPPLALASILVLWAVLEVIGWVREGARPPPADLLPQPLVPDLNRSPERHLLLLPGIGPVRARAIVAERARGGPFARLEDVQRVRGIGPHTLAGFRALATAGGPWPPRRGGARRRPPP